MVYPHLYRTEHSETHTTNSVYGDYIAKQQSRKIHIQPKLLKILQYIDSNREVFVTHLKKIVEIRSVAHSLEHQKDVKRMVEVTEEWLAKLGVKFERFNIGFYEVDGKQIRLPTIILGSLGHDPRKKTVCVYGHIDALDPDKKWSTDPWTVDFIDRHFYGNGVASGKAVLLAWFHAIEAFQFNKLEIPVNLKFIIEGMGHHRSTGLAEFLPLRKQDFLYDIDNVVVCDSEWLGEKHPCIIYGTIGSTEVPNSMTTVFNNIVLGVIHLNLSVEKGAESKMEPKEEMQKIFEETIGNEERVLVPGFYDIVEQITPEEEKRYESIKDFDIEEARKYVPPFKRSWDQVRLLMNYWRLPSIFMDEIKECTCDKQDTTMVKRHIIVKTVPKQIIGDTKNAVVNHIESVTKKLNTGNNVRCEYVSHVRHWFENVKCPFIEAARRATIQIYKEDPNMIREDRARYVITVFDRILEKPILLLPLATKGSNVGGDNENISKKNFIECRKLIAAYLYQISDEITS